MVALLKRLRAWFDAAPLSLFVPKPKAPGLEKLYVLRVDFKMSPEAAKNMDASLQPLRDKYGLDFIVLEPGMNVARFDDI